MVLNYEYEMKKIYEVNKENPYIFFKASSKLLIYAALDDYVSVAEHKKLCDLFEELTQKLEKGE